MIAVPVHASRSLRALFATLAAAVAVLVAAPSAWGAGETISGTVTDGTDPLTGICVTAEGLAGDVLTTSASDGTYTLAVASGDYLVRFDDCGTSAYESQYYENAPDQDTAATVTVGAEAHVAAIDATMVPVPPDDGRPPETTIDSGPTGAISETTVSFEFHSTTDPGANFECSFDGGSFGPCSSPQTYDQLGDGPHHFEVRAVDGAGNRDPSPEGRDFTINSPAPDGVITSGPDSETITVAQATFEFTSDDPQAQYICHLDEKSNPCTSPVTYDAADLDNGPHIFKLRAVTQDNDYADQTPAIRSFYVNVNGPEDLDPPETAITDGPVGTISTTGTAFSFESDENGSTFECQVDSDPFASCQSPQIVTGLVNGSHTFSVRATDAAGNVEAAPATRTFTVDTTADTAPPDTVITSGPQGVVAQNFAAFGFSSTEANSTFECSFDGSPFTSCTSPRTYTSLADGLHTFEVQARDASGNVDGSSPAFAIFTVSSILPADVDAPETTIDSGPDAPITTRSASFGFSSSEPGSSFECRLDLGSWRRCSSPHSYTGLADGPHTFQARAIDPAGNRDISPDSRSFSVDATPPDTNITGGPDGQSVNPSSPQDYTFNSSEAGTTFECRLDSGLWSDCSSPYQLPEMSEGTHTFQVRAKDAIGNLDGTPAVSGFTIDTTAPQTTFDSGPSGTVRQASQFQFHANEPSSFECRLDGGGWGQCNSPYDTGTLADGSHTFEVRARDNAGNTEGTPASRTFAIDTAAPNTTIDAGPTGTIASDSASFGFSASEAGATFQCKLDSNGWAPCNSPQAFTGLSQGSHTFFVRASDGLDNQDASPASRTFTVDVQTTQPPPPTGPSAACATAQKKLQSAKAALKKAQKKAKKAKSRSAKKRAKKKVKKAKKKVRSAKRSVASAC